MLEWNYEKGNLDDATKKYTVEACRIAKERGGLIHCFCVGRVLEQADVSWLKEVAAQGHPIGNHTYDHVNVKATKAEETQFRFQRSPWLTRGMTATQLISENIRMTTAALKERAGITVNGFRTPGGFTNGLEDRKDIQQMLLDLGHRWVSAKYPDHPSGTPKEEPVAEIYSAIVKAQVQAQPSVYPSGLVEVPMSPISDVNAFRTHYWKLGWFLKALRLAVTWAIDTGSVFDFLAHPSCLVVEDPGFESIKLICDLVRSAGDQAAIVGLDTIAARVANK
jgi:peptidoglycan/xylan/chitin deacetylase (PgdA/CDA1 family)